MELITTHVIKFSPIDLPEFDILQKLQKTIIEKSEIFPTDLTEGLSEYFSNKLVFTELDGYKFSNSSSFRMELSIFEGGFGVLKSASNHSEDITVDQLIKISDKITNDIKINIKSNSLINEISKFFGNWFTVEETDHNPASLMWAYSQSCIFETSNSFDRFCFELSEDKPYIYNDVKIKFNPSTTILFFQNKVRKKTALKLINSVTLSTALAYSIQNTSIKLSREILQNPNLNQKFSSIDLYVRLVNIMDQYLIEIHQDDLIANLDEVVFAKPQGNTFDLEKVINKSFRAVSRLKDHVKTLENEISRRQQKRMNNILFTFTLLSVVSVSGGVVSLYDFANDISPNIRLAIVFITFVSSTSAAAILLTRLGKSKLFKKKNRFNKNM